MSSKKVAVRIGLALGLVVILAILASRALDRVFKESMASSIELKRAHSSNGKIVSISSLQQGHAQSKICFSIDSFSDVRADYRNEYEVAERAKIAKQGPECIVNQNTPLPANLKAGDPIEVVYLLYGRGDISIARIVVSGQDVY